MPDRPVRKPRRTTVETVEQLTPNMVRVVVGGEGLEDFGAGEFSDHYVKLQLPARDADYGSDFDPEEIKATRPRELWPRVRTYSVRDWDEAAPPADARLRRPRRRGRRGPVGDAPCSRGTRC